MSEGRAALQSILVAWNSEVAALRNAPVELEDLGSRLLAWMVGTFGPTGFLRLTLPPELGKRYVRRDGKVTGAMTFADPRRRTGFCDPFSGWVYAQDGTAGVHPELPHPMDLVAEFNPAQPE